MPMPGAHRLSTEVRNITGNQTLGSPVPGLPPIMDLGNSRGQQYGEHGRLVVTDPARAAFHP